jgi:hypothetical protein
MKTTVLALSLAWLPFCIAAEPAPKADQPPPAKAKTVTATLLGKEITAEPGDDLNGTIFRELSERHMKENDIRVSDTEIALFHEAVDQKRKESVEQWKRDKDSLEKDLKSAELSEEARKELNDKLTLTTKMIDGEKANDERRKANPAADLQSRNAFASQLILAWKFSQSLFRKYGGRVIFQQAGPEPLDAYRDFLRAHEKAGDFKILNEEAKTKFWAYFVTDGAHTFYSEEEGKKMMTTPWWLGNK